MCVRLFYQKSIYLSSRLAARCVSFYQAVCLSVCRALVARVARRRAEALLHRLVDMMSANGPRRVYIDAGANWANTLQLYRDIAPNASNQPFEVYAFEASPLITPFLEHYCDWLNGGGIGAEPSSCLPRSGSTEHLNRYASAMGCPAGTKRGESSRMRACMWSLFAKPLAALAPDPRLQSRALLEQRLSVAKLASALTKASRTRYTLIPAGVAAENAHITIDSNPQQLIRGGAFTVDAKASKYVFRVPVVDLVGWIRTSFKPADEVVLKIDVEGAEHEIFDRLTLSGGWDRIDVLVFECHARPERSCANLTASVRAAAPHLKLYEERRGHLNADLLMLPNGLVYSGIDSESGPTKPSILAMVRSCGLGLRPLGSANSSKGVSGRPRSTSVTNWSAIFQQKP